jgi:hypothetical protein
MISGLIASEASFDTQVVMAAPFSAVAVTESVQVLADGNRIVHKSSSSISRDAQGRTRREQTVTYVNSESPNGESYQTVFVNDPIAGSSFTLNTKDHIAQKMNASYRYMRTDVPAGGGGGRGGAMPAPTGGTLRTVMPDQPAPGTVGGAVGTGGGGGMVARKVSPESEPAVKVPSVVGGVYSTTTSPALPTLNSVQVVAGTRIKPEVIQLGKQSFEGVEAEGTKTVLTIPAGQIGNEQPIIIESEAWYSADLHQVVMSRHSDPRYGESTYKLTNINRNEPDHSLFEVPSDYTVKESPSVARPMMRKKPDEQKEPQQ